jgi:prevent-host-death family protein
MTTVSVREAREKLARLLDSVAAGEEVVILRRGQPVARLVPAQRGRVSFQPRRHLRESLPPMRRRATEEVRAGREDERG